tara:strand:- start:523 stop:885 length:363 start_codon:yes stop_codon:yes gene_type:complete
MNYVNKFEYHVPYKNIGSENEICGTLLGVVDDFKESSLIRDEISAIKWISPDELKHELENNVDIYCPWMVIALYYLVECELETKSKFSSMISDWTKDEMMQNYEKAIKHHIPENNWRLVN